ncbi:membrane integrity-associated transporter subunit PqiC [Albidovulum sediminicola]|uniref:PqiC family protein n=1 Tax=Albidovulum sediminicola TaxID=2984331 RepID=A0ABT2YXA4_9RHOB|nr:PqiC family protein [Defluviimonas sp. WL0075]MCV2863481.1 PqiC family protein [Defluviimonas sp. WL0075]
MSRLALLCLTLALTGCADNAGRFVLDTPAPAARTAVAVSSIEVLDVALPAYAAAVEIARQDDGGAVRNLPDSLWADEPVRGITAALARSLDLATTATVAPEPWPLEEPAQARVAVHVEKMLARADGGFDFEGQFAVSAPLGGVRERIERFAIHLPAGAVDSAGIAAASGTAVARLAEAIARSLAR